MNDFELSDFEDIILEIQDEIIDAINKFAAFNSYHEGYAVLLEEVDELWKEIKKKNFDREKIKKEALQVATMGIRFMLDLCQEKEE